MAYAPDPEAFGVAAKALGEDAGAWRDALRGVCATRGAQITEGLALAYAKPFEEGAVDFDEPLLRTVADELAALKRRVDRRVTELPPTPSPTARQHGYNRRRPRASSTAATRPSTTSRRRRTAMRLASSC